LENRGQQTAAVRILPFVICGGKVAPDVSHRRSPEQGVTNGVQSDVAVRVRLEAPGMRYPHAAEHDVIAPGEGVHIQSLAYTEIQAITSLQTAAAK
jgi:hypothetical protein